LLFVCGQTDAAITFFSSERTPAVLVAGMVVSPPPSQQFPCPARIRLGRRVKIAGNFRASAVMALNILFAVPLSPEDVPVSNDYDY